jgi:AraC family transcriptional regulator
MTAQTEPQIVEKKACRVAGLRYEGKNEHGEVPALWDQFIPRVGELVPDATHWVGYGIGRAIPGVDAAEKWEYLAGVEVAPEASIPADMVAWEIPALTYAVLPAHDVPGIGPVTDYYYGEWLPQSAEWEGGEALMMEVYPVTYSEDLIMYLHFPIKRKGRS